jgi:hypothetical protein
MSFDLFVQCFRNGERATFPRSVFDGIFGRHAISPEFPTQNVKYPDGSGGEIYGGENDEIDGLMFTHFGGDMIFAAIYELAHKTGSVIYWPDTIPSVAVTEPETTAHLPDGFDKIGPPHLVQDHRALMDYIARRE